MLITGISHLVTNRADQGRGAVGLVPDAAIVISDGRVAWVGPTSATPQAAGDTRVDVAGRCVIPGFVDAHTHLVFAGDRAGEFEARLAGTPYDGAGIAHTVRRTRQADFDELAARTRLLAAEALRSGTTTLEVKSGYGLSTEHEQRLLQVVEAVTAPQLPALVPTFLGAHVTPPEYQGRPDDYVAAVVDDMLPVCAPLAQWCDAFCEESAFDAAQSRAVLEAGRSHGLGLRVHANQLRPGPGARLAAELGAASADHLTHLTDADIAALADAGVVATLLPAAEFSTRSVYAPARRLADAGVTVALATDCNPGTSFTTSMPFVVALACREMGMSPDEAVWSATAGGAASLRRDDIGHLGLGAVADVTVLDAPSHVHLAYRPGMNQIHAVYRQGRLVHQEPARG